MMRYFKGLIAALAVAGMASAGFAQTINEPTTDPVSSIATRNLAVDAYTSITRANDLLSGSMIQNGVAWLGDSRARSQYNDPLNRNQNAGSFINVAAYLTDSRFRTVYNGAVAGYTTAQATAPALVNAAIASRAKFVAILAGVNDFGPGGTGRQAFLNIKSACERVLIYGRTCILFTEPGATGFIPAHIGHRNDLNALLAQYSATRGNVFLFDYAASLVDANNTTTSIRFKADQAYDTTHLSKIGAFNEGVNFAAFISTLTPPRPQVALDPLSASGYGTAQQLTNPFFMTTTGGTIATAGAVSSGTVPAGWQAIRAGSGSAAITYAPSASGYGNDLIANITFTAAGDNFGVRQYVTAPANAKPGDIVEGRVTVTVDAGSTNLKACWLNIAAWTDNLASAVNYFANQPTPSASDSLTPSPSVAYTFNFRTDPMATPAASTTNVIDRFDFTIRCEGLGSGSANVRISRASLRKFLPTE